MKYNYTCSITKRGKKQIEIRTNYLLTRTRKKKQRFCLNAYIIYTPAQLGIHNERYSKETFFNNFVSNTRYKTPEMDLNQLISSECELSPITRLDKIFKEKNSEKSKDSYIVYELKTLLNIFQNQLKASSDQLIMGMSIRIEKTAGRIHNALSKNGYSLELGIRSIDIIGQQIDYRVKSGYGTRVSRSNPAITEYMLYREQEIKKWAESSMYMSKNETNTVNNLIQIMLGAAAAIAMSFAVFASIISLKWFDSGSVYWAIIAVIAYILKDRIKDGLRAFFLKYIPRLTSDKVQIIWVQIQSVES